MAYQQNSNNITQAVKFAFGYFTVLPVKSGYFEANKEFYKTVVFTLPLVGFVLALIVVASYEFVFTHTIYSAFICSLFYIFLTGFLHLEAVADTIDGWYASFGKKDIYEVMHEPQIGSIGAVATFCITLLQIASLMYCLYEQYYLVIFLSFVLSRFGVYFALIFDFHKKSIFINEMKNAITFNTVLKIVFFPLNIVVNLILNILKNRLGFLNGDTLGFMIVVVEIIVLNTGIVLC